MKGNSLVLRAAWLVMVCASCEVSEAPQDETMASTSQPVSTPTAQVFETAIAVRDAEVTALIGRVAEGRVPPTDLKIAFFDAGGDLLETVSAVTAQGSSSGLVYAAPMVLLTEAHQWNAIAASSAKVIVGPFVQPVYLGQARGSISVFAASYGYDGCPDCIANYLCNCLWELDQVPPPSWCHTLEPMPNGRPCELITRLQPVARN